MNPPTFLRRALRILWMLPAAAGLSWGATLPSGFTETTVGGSWLSPVGVAIGPNASGTKERAYVWERGGRVWITENDARLASPLIDLSDEVADWGDYGLLGFALDPDFAQNGYIYCLYVVDRYHLLNAGQPGYDPAASLRGQRTIGRLTRYTCRRDDDFRSVDPASRRVLLGESITTGIPILHSSHGVGSLVFATDGTLMVSCGDGASYQAMDNGGTAGGSFGTQGVADGIIRPDENVGAYRCQMINSLSGKLLRLDPATGDGVPGNPYYNGSAPRAAASRVWSYGLRNPCRFTLKPGTGSHHAEDGNPGTFYIGDVGWTTYEELMVADGPAQNFGWPLYEGYGQQSNYWQARPAGMNADNHKPPAIEWRHGTSAGARALYNGSLYSPGAAGSPVTGTNFGGNAACGGAFYTATAFPAEWHGRYFQADYSGQWIRAFTMDDANQVTSVRPFATGEAFVYLTVHPRSGELYYVSVPDGSRPGTVRRIAYAPGGNRPPVAVASVDRQYGASPLTVQFSSGLSSDPEGAALSYTWNFGDGTTSTEANPRKIYTGTGPLRFDATLTVRDAGGASAVSTLIITANNTPPAVQITSPAPGLKYSTSQNHTAYNLTAAVSDAENPLNTLTHQWQVSLVHDNHEHLEPLIDAATGTMTVEGLGNDPAATFYYRILLRVTDPLGLTTVTERLFMPETGNSAVAVNPDFTTLPQGGARLIEVLANDHGAVTDADFSTLQIVSAPAAGTAVPDPVTGRILYRHNGSAGLADNFTYRIRTKAGTLSPECRVDVMIQGTTANHPPVALGDAATVGRGQSVNIPLLANDLDPAGSLAPGGVVLHSLPPSGTLSLNASTGAVTYTHNNSALTADTFTYSAADAAGLRSAPVTVKITVTAAGGAPVIANPGSQASVRGSSVNLAISASDPNGQPLTYTASGLPAGLSIGSSSGIISGNVSAAAQSSTVTVTVSDGSLTASATFAWTINAPASGNGLTAEYFTGLTPGANPPVLTRTDATLNFDWDQGSPGGGVPVDQFSARWTGDLTARYSETYTFSIPVDNGVRIWVDGTLILDKWLPVGTGGWHNVNVPLTAGRRTPFKVEYYEEWGGAGLVLYWFSPSQAWEVVPASAFAPAGGSAGDTTPPAVTLTTASAAVSGPFTAGVSFSESITGLTASDFNVTNATITGLTGSGGTWSLAITPAAAGNVTVSLPAGRCYDAAGNGNTASSTLTVSYTAPANRAPVVSDPGAQSSYRGSITALPIQATDPDGHAVTWTAAGLPPGLAIQSATGLISGTISLSAAASYNVTVTARDPAGAAGTAAFVWNTAAVPGTAAAGLQGQYFSGLTPGTGAALVTRTDAVINFDWAGNSPAAGVPADQFSVRWTGELIPAFTEQHTFTIAGDNGYRLWIDNTLVIDNWMPIGTGGWRSANVNLTAARRTPIRLEYYDEWGGAGISLYWNSTRQPWEVIPASRLVPPGGSTPAGTAGTVLDAVRANFTITRGTGGHTQVAFTRPPSTAGTSLFLEASADLRTWQTVDLPATVTRSPGGSDDISVRVLSGAPSLPSRYFRLRVLGGE